MVRGPYRRRKKTTNRKGNFNPDDTANVRHTRIGVWDLYEDINPTIDKIPGSSRIEHYLEGLNTLPYVWRMLKDISTLPRCWYLLVLFVLTQFIHGLVPAVSLWYSGALLDVVRTAVEKRTVDTRMIFSVAAAKFGCAVCERVLAFIELQLSTPINFGIRRLYSAHIFHAMARLDVPTYDDAAVQKQLDQALSPRSDSSVAWDALSTLVRMFRTVVQVVSQLSVLVAVLSSQPDAVLLSALSLLRTLMDLRTYRPPVLTQSIWAATTTDVNYIKLEGLKKLVSSPAYRKELVAGGMWQPLLDIYRRCASQVGDNALPFYDAHHLSVRSKFRFTSFAHDLLAQMPQIIFAFRAVQYPTSIPVSLASLNLITQTADKFVMTLFSLFHNTGNILDLLIGIRRLYDIVELPNKVRDGNVPFPEDSNSLKFGVSLEFRNVSFKYPESDLYAVRDLSFTLQPGQLCVIVGQNGSGKSTILKLIARIYDPTEGEIYLDGRDIKTIRLDDLRRATSVLFQDYTYFPLSIKLNIGLGDPGHAEDEDRIVQAARLGGAEDFIEKLPEKFDTYLERPIQDHYSALPEGTTTLFGRPVDYGGIRHVGGMSSHISSSLSGGQLQRIALSRTFMRSVVSDAGVGLLLFDEPSASLDPAAEHDLFERLRALRGNKTMVFSTHRFGMLTRHADIILCIHDSEIIEHGTHDELLRNQGEYARLWMLQAQQFLP